MKRTSLQSILFNAAGAGVLLFVAAYMANSFFRPEEITQCAQRYPRGEQFSLQNSKGELLSPIELQARVPTREWGLLRNSRVVASPDKTVAYLQVSMAAAAEDEETEVAQSASSGIGFVWQPASLSSVRSACLSYRVFMPKDFSFANAGSLPGLFAARDLEELDASQPKAGFVARLGWQKEGNLGMDVRTPTTAGLWMRARNQTWPVNRWVTVEQEVVLNTPGKADGTVRLWVDSELKVNNSGVSLGADDKITLSGVVSDIGYNQKEAKASRLTISPFLVRYQ